MEKEKKKLEIQGMIVPPGGLPGPFFLKVLKGGRVRDFQNQPKGKHIVYYIESYDFYNQDKWYYFTLRSPDGTVTRVCDYDTHCGYDRGPGFDKMVRRMWYGNLPID
jgi:hypothetical protein